MEQRLIAFLTEHQSHLFLVGLILLLAGWIGFFRQQRQLNELGAAIRGIDPEMFRKTLPKIPLAHIAKSDISPKVVLDQKQEY